LTKTKNISTLPLQTIKVYDKAFHDAKECLINMLIRDGKIARSTSMENDFYDKCLEDPDLVDTWESYATALVKHNSPKTKTEGFSQWFRDAII
jgi:dsDNA-binding SOS-regulon protein